MAASDLERLAPLLAAYLLHSTLWLGGCGAVLWLAHVRRPALRHAAWKWSAVAGFATALAQFALPVSSRSLDLTLMALADPAAKVPVPQGVAVDESQIRRSLSSRFSTTQERTMFDAGEPSQAIGPLAGERPADGTLLGKKARDKKARDKKAQDKKAQDKKAQDGAFGASGRRTMTLDWLRAAVTLWIVAAGLLMTRTLMAWRRLSRLGDLTELSTGKERELLDRLLAATNIRRKVHLFRSQSGGNPMAWGFFRWRIAVPGPLVERLQQRELRALLAHELAHLARGDTRWLCAWSLLGAIGFLQPLNRIAQRQIRRAAELLSDSWAVQATGDRLSLARALTKTAELRGDRALPLASPAVVSASALTERVDRLVGPNQAADEFQRGRWLTVVVGSTAIAAAVVWLPGVRLRTVGGLTGELPRRSDAPVSIDDPVQALDRELDFLDLELGELRPFVTASRDPNADGKDVAEAWRAIERRRGSVHEGHVRLKKLLKQNVAAEKSPAGGP